MRSLIAVVIFGAVALVSGCNLGEENDGATARDTVSTRYGRGDDRPSYQTFAEGGVSFRYPSGWTVSGFSKTNLPRRLAVASYAIRNSDVEGDCGGYAAVEKLPPVGALVLLIDYGAGRRGGFRARPSRLRLKHGEYHNYECFGESTMFRFRVGRHALQAHVAVGSRANPSMTRQALRVLESIRTN